MKFFFKILFISYFINGYAQNNQISIDANLHPKEKIIVVKQTLVYHNKTNDTLQKIVLRNWGNSYKNDSTPLAKRLLTDYRTSFYFSRKKDRGFSKVSKLTVNGKTNKFTIKPNYKDLVFIELKETLAPQQKTSIYIEYNVKIPNAKYTGSGFKSVDFFLKDWLITPSYFKDKWILNTHQNLNYQYNTPTNYNITFKTPLGYHIYSNFSTKTENKSKHTTHYLKGKNITNPQLSIVFAQTYLQLETPNTKIITNFFSPDIDFKIQKEKMSQMMDYLHKNIGDIYQTELLVEKNSYKQNPIYELKFLPKALHPYSDEFKWEAEFFKALSSTYISQVLVHNQNDDYWFTKGLETYIFAKYINTFYPKTKLIGRLSQVWGLKSMHIAKQNFNSKFSIVHQITARDNLDQKLTTPLSQLSNYNRKVISPYKAGIGFMFLKEYVEPNLLDRCIKEFVKSNVNKVSKSTDFINLLSGKTKKDIHWFFDEWINTNKKIDHQIVNTNFLKDSIQITLKNKKSIKTPVLLYGLQENKIKTKLWIDGFTNKKTISIQNDSIDKIVLNYANIYPEVNYTNNWSHHKKKLIQRPLKLNLLKDLNNPNTQQIFLKPEANFNVYDGVLLGLSIQNEGYLRQNLHYNLKPTYGIKSKSLNGSLGFNYTILPEETNVYKVSFGIAGSHYQYDDNLDYNTLSPSFSLSFKQKDFRALGNNTISARYSWIDRDVASGLTVTDQDKYGLLKIDYTYSKNKLVHNYSINTNTEIASNFTKLNAEFLYRHLSNKKRPIELRFFGGVFLTNRTKSDFFSYNQHTANDYLFELPYFGRSETEGIVSQQYIKAQGGFISQNNPGFANQWLTTINSSIGIYKWAEIFTNVGLLKNKNTPIHFDYETGVRLNFIPQILELYFPLYNKEGFLTQQGKYINNFRFVLTLKSGPIFSFIRQQIF